MKSRLRHPSFNSKYHLIADFIFLNSVQIKLINECLDVGRSRGLSFGLGNNFIRYQNHLLDRD